MKHDGPAGRLSGLRERFSGRLVLSVIGLLLLLTTCWLVRRPLLRAVGDHLITPDPQMRCDAIYVLGGSPLERGLAAAHLLDRGLAPVAYCTGSNIPTVLEAAGFTWNEAELSRMAALRAGADSARVQLLPRGTSTWEESNAIFLHAWMLGHDTITVVSTEFHLRRVRRVFRKRFAKEGMTVLLHGATSDRYDHRQWWRSEEGLLMVNNEYVKLVYYLLRY
ncbi:MAG: YdcF family protein [Flavobacteriales bacterium]|nr:YdcF family protein [Flavobacteriales bacterium]